MTIDLSTIFEILTSLLIPTVVYLFTITQRTRDDLQEYKLYVSNNYTNNQTIEKILEKLDAMSEQINQIMLSLTKVESRIQVLEEKINKENKI